MFKKVARWAYKNVYGEEALQQGDKEATENAKKQLDELLPYLSESFDIILKGNGPVVINVEKYESNVISLLRKTLYEEDNIRKCVQVSLLRNDDGERIMKLDLKSKYK